MIFGPTADDGYAPGSHAKATELYARYLNSRGAVPPMDLPEYDAAGEELREEMHAAWARETGGHWR